MDISPSPQGRERRSRIMVKGKAAAKSSADVKKEAITPKEELAPAPAEHLGPVIIEGGMIENPNAKYLPKIENAINTVMSNKLFQNIQSEDPLDINLKGATSETGTLRGPQHLQHLYIGLCSIAIL